MADETPVGKLKYEGGNIPLMLPPNAIFSLSKLEVSDGFDIKCSNIAALLALLVAEIYVTNNQYEN